MEKNIWLTSKDLMDRWRINAPSLWYYIRKKGLPAHPIAPEQPNAWTWVQNVERGLHQPSKQPSSLNDIMRSLTKLVFHSEEIVKFEKTEKINLSGEIIKPDSTSTKNQTATDYDQFVRSLRISYENDSEIKIQKPEKLAFKRYGYTHLGFQSPMNIAWRDFLEILENPDHSYDVGPAHKYSHGDRQRLKDYDRKLRRLDQISHKLIRFIENTFGLQAPKGFKFYERRRGDKPGIYILKFQVIDGRFQSTNKQILLKIQNYEKKKKLSQEEKHDLTDLIIEVRNRHLMTNEEIKDKFGMLAESYKGDEKIKYDPYENEKNLDQD